MEWAPRWYKPLSTHPIRYFKHKHKHILMTRGERKISFLHTNRQPSLKYIHRQCRRYHTFPSIYLPTCFNDSFASSTFSTCKSFGMMQRPLHYIRLYEKPCRGVQIRQPEARVCVIRKSFVGRYAYGIIEISPGTLLSLFSWKASTPADTVVRRWCSPIRKQVLRL